MTFNLDTFTSGGGASEDFAKSAKDWIDKNQMAALALFVVMLVCTLYVLWLVVVGKWINPLAPVQSMIVGQYQSGNPTGLARAQKLDGLGQVGQGLERAAAGAPAHAAVAGPDPSSLAYQVLHSADYACDSRVAADEDAWGWMKKQTGTPESFKTEAPGLLTDSALSAIGAGGRH
jgi:hypothetical protein